MSDQGSTYAVLQSVPVMVSPLYRLPKKIVVANELKMVPDDVTKLPTYPFAVERDVIAQVEAARKQTFEAEQAFQQLKKQYQQDRLNKQKQAARKIAPGFLDTDTRILKPEQTYTQEFPMPYSSEEESISANTSPHMLKPSASNTTAQDKVLATESSPDKFDYLKFEQGLAPADPWDTPENDMVALRSILASPKNDFNVKRTPTPPSYPPQQYQNQPQQSQQSQQHQQQQARPYQKNEGVYWSFQTNMNNSPNPMYSPQQALQRQVHSTNSVPALPPKLFNPLPSSSTSSPIMSPPAPPVLPPPSDYHKSTSKVPTPPPLPPLPTTSPHENLITELGIMGFSRAQAIDALEKNDNDLIKATNFLLDQA